MKTNKYVIVIIIVFVFLYACSDVYLSLSEGVQEIFCYKEGDYFSLLENESNDTLIFEITNYVNEYDKESYNPLNPNQYHQYVSIEFESENNYSGYMYSEGHGKAQVNISISSHILEIFNGSLCDTLYNHTLNNKEYPELYVFAEEKGQKPMLYFTKDEGIVYIDSTANGNSYALIEYIKGGE